MVVGAMLHGSRHENEIASRRQLLRSLLPKDVATLVGRHLSVSVQLHSHFNKNTTTWKYRPAKSSPHVVTPPPFIHSSQRSAKQTPCRRRVGESPPSSTRRTVAVSFPQDHTTRTEKTSPPLLQDHTVRMELRVGDVWARAHRRTLVEQS